MKLKLKGGISCKGLDAAFEAEETRKSNLLLEVMILRAQKQYDDASLKVAQAAIIEHRLGDICEEKGLLELSWIHRNSEVSCWALAGNIHEAIIQGEALLARADLPDRLRLHFEKYLKTLRRRRAKWWEEHGSSKASRPARTVQKRRRIQTKYAKT
jgi:hypothetical protein